MSRWLSIGALPLLLTLAVPCHGDIYYYRDIRTGSLYVTNISETNPIYQLLRVQRSLTISDLRSNKGKGVPPPSSYAPVNLIGMNANFIGFPRKRGKPLKVNEQNRKFYTPHIERVAKIYDLDPRLVHAVISAESAYNPNAVSNKGAMGLMQLMPDTARRFGVNDPLNPLENLSGGARYLRWLMDRFQNTRLALAAYNAGEGAVERYGNTIPPYAETQTYVVRVLNFYSHYQLFN